MWAAATIAAGLAWAQSEQGAKALFHDSTSGVTLQSPGAPKPTPRPTTTTSTTTSTRPASPKPAPVTGLMYYVELLQPSGEALRVNTTRGFRSNDRIRFHVLSNVSGRLAILQSENGGAFEPLFPHPQLRGGDDRVESGVETVIPMRFDSRPGKIKLLMMVTAASAPQPPQERRSEAPAPSVPRPQAPYDPRAPIGKPRPPDEGQILAQIRLQQGAGSKGLKVETDDSPKQAAQYAVSVASPESKLPAGVVAAELEMTHSH
jgi:hypothetical protein